MNATDIFNAVQQAGAALRVEGDSLVASNASRLAPELKAAIRQNKPQLITALAGPVCAVCGATGDLWHHGEAPVHEECARFLPRPEPAEPTAAYRGVSTDPDGTGCCAVTIVELPTEQRYRKTFALLQTRPAALVPIERWRQCVEDGKRFLAKWGEQAQALNWGSADLFGLHTPPEQPHPSYWNRLGRYDQTGLIWLLQGRPVVVLTADTAAIENANGTITTYRKHHKPALGPLGDSLDDLK
jgi:hypothetical protein